MALSKIESSSSEEILSSDSSVSVLNSDSESGEELNTTCGRPGNFVKPFVYDPPAQISNTEAAVSQSTGTDDSAIDIAGRAGNTEW